RPIAFSIPTSSSTIVGFVFPARGSGPIDFVTTAPAPALYTRSSVPPVSSRKPDASIVGFRSFNPAIVVETFGTIRGESGALLKSCAEGRKPLRRSFSVRVRTSPGRTFMETLRIGTVVRIADLGLDPRITAILEEQGITE